MAVIGNSEKNKFAKKGKPSLRFNRLRRFPLTLRAQTFTLPHKLTPTKKTIFYIPP